MPKIIVDVMPKPEILDPQGKAIGAALARLGIEGFREVRQGKRFELTIDLYPQRLEGAFGGVATALLRCGRDGRTEKLDQPRRAGEGLPSAFAHDR